ncbi:MAG: TonB-dependent receptor plug domain-containing protein, partial [Spirosomataceae bacterium]
DRPARELAAPIAVIPLKSIEKMEQPSLLPLLNTVAGVRMEERSPGSFRLSIRGSSIRSPFGVRNVKVYWEGIALTDASGGTYLNLVDLSNIGGIEIIKGPAGSLYGAGTGGVMLLSARGKSVGSQENTQEIRSQVMLGSYGLRHLSTGYAVATDKMNASLSLAQVEADGYRDHTNLKRNSAQWQGSFYVSPARTIQSLLLVGDIAYQTPGGLTAAQMAANRRAARP